MKRSVEMAFAFFVALSGLGCGGRQSAPPPMDTRPLEEVKAQEIIEEVLTARGYAFEKEVPVRVANTNAFSCDYRVKGKGIAIEYLTDKDRQIIGPIPEPAEGSRLHVLLGTASPGDGTGDPPSVYLFFIDDGDFIYHANPTSEARADVTYLEVDSRLRRDLADFLSWYEDSESKR